MPTIVSQVLWHGTAEEASELVDVLTRHCSCKFSARGELRATCAPHRMLIDDQRALNGLLFARRMARRFRLEEFAPGGVNAPGATSQ